MRKNLKDFFHEMKKKGKEIVITIRDESKESYNEITGFASVKVKLEDSFYNLGNSLYEAYKSNPTSNVYAEFEKQLKEIDVLIEKKEVYEASVNNRFGKSICPNCKSKIDINNTFCPNCGTANFSKNKRDFVCQSCGTKNPDDHEFCGKCGTKLP